MSRTFRDGAGPQLVGYSEVGQIHGEYGVPWLDNSTVSRVFCGRADL